MQVDTETSTSGKSPVLGKRKLEDLASCVDTTTAISTAQRPSEIQSQPPSTTQQQADSTGLLKGIGIGGIDPGVLAAFLRSVGGVEGVKRMKMVDGSG